jgi:molybdate transport system substrate-binding protein
MVFGASGALARQIRSGAPYDVYLSANEEFVSGLLASGHLLAGSTHTYALGRLAIWSPKGDIRTLNDLLRPEVKRFAIANPLHAPYGMAARDALRNRSLWERLKPKIVYGENVRQALQYGESRNVDAVVTSWSLVFDKGAVLIPADYHKPIRQAGGILSTSKNPQAAAKVLEYLTGPQGKALLESHGLGRVE